MLTEHSVAAAAAAAGLPAPAGYVESTGSTNADLIAAGNEGAPAWTVLVAGHQTDGRGRLGRRWEAPPGSSLLVSVLLRPSTPPDESPLVSLAAGLATAEGIEAVSDLRVACEWPNDLVTTAGRKLAGVLVEGRIEDGRVVHVVVGVGINLTQSAEDFPGNLRLLATSLAMEGAAARPPELLTVFLERLHGRYDPDREGFADAVLRAYRPRCTTIGRTVSATTVAGETIQGVASGIGSNGELIVATDAGDVTVAFGEIERLG